ncbi:MAG: glycosyltransferase family 4 protein [Leptolyngbya sp. SIO4C1]|nr:glycosyltransferase family 4 protein [Leptolyngbya sp. SIO4C1]
MGDFQPPAYRAVHTVARYFPEDCGGIQMRLSELLPLLTRYGISSKIAAAHAQSSSTTYVHKDIEVFRYPAVPQPPAEPNHGAFPHAGFEQFAHWLSEQQAELYHQHQWTPSCGLPHLRYAKQLGLKTIVSIRLPQAICQRQTLMLNGTEPCDGKIDVARCTQCCEPIAQALPATAMHLFAQLPAAMWAQLPLPASLYAPTAIPNQKVAPFRALSTPAFIEARRRSLLEMAEQADRIIMLSELLRDMFIRNGVPKDKLVMVRTGLPEYVPTVTASRRRTEGPLKVVFLGRWNRTKGIHILVDAVERLPESVPIELSIHGVPNDEHYEREVRASISDSSRIRIKPQLQRDSLADQLSQYDVLAAPAQWFDVRPMVVLEGHACKLPVLGSNMGGIPELINDGVDGLLLPPSDPQAWADALAKLACDRAYLEQLQQGIRPVRRMQAEAADMAQVYQSLLGQPSLAAAMSA